MQAYTYEDTDEVETTVPVGILAPDWDHLNTLY